MNLKGFYYLFLKETKRFLKVWSQTLLGPVITSLLFLFVFVIALNKNNINYSGSISFIEFLVPGLIMMQVVQNAFANTSSSVLMAKLFGTINDILAAPLNSKEIVLGYVLSSVLRGILVGFIIFLTCFLVTYFYSPITTIHNIFLAIYFLFIASFIMGTLGLLCGLWANNYDRISTITNLVIMPLSFLSGTFYSVNNLPAGVHIFTKFNPIFYMIDGFRYSLAGINDFNVILEVIVLFMLATILYGSCVLLVKKGYKIKS